MKQSLGLPGALLGVVLVLGLSGALAIGRGPQSPVYTVDEAATLLRRDPAAWEGRTVLVRGVAEPCRPGGSPARFVSCHHRALDHLVPGLVGASASLALAWASPNTWLTLLRRLPAVGRLLPEPQRLQWGDEATYRVQLHTVPSSACTDHRCFEAVLVDAAP